MMFITLLLATFALALVVSLIIMKLFSKPLESILNRIIDDPISMAWVKYMKFAILVVGVSSGVRIYQLEKYVVPQITDKDHAEVMALTSDLWILELYRTVIESLEGIAWMLLVFFIVALLAYVAVRWRESRGLK